MPGHARFCSASTGMLVQYQLDAVFGFADIRTLGIRFMGRCVSSWNETLAFLFSDKSQFGPQYQGDGRPTGGIYGRLRSASRKLANVKPHSSLRSPPR